MLKKLLIIVLFMVPTGFAWSQVTPTDTIPRSIIDNSTLDDQDFEDLLSDLDLFLDSLLKPRSFFQVNLSAAAGYFNYVNRNDYVVAVKKKVILSPLIGYFHKSGLGISAAANMIRGKTNYSLYQSSITPSFDLIQNKKWTGGISYTRYITKDSLHFYTTPLQNEIGMYYLWRKAWLQPGFTANYGWGSRSDVKERIETLTRIILKEVPVRRNSGPTTIIDTILVTDTIRTRITTRESIVDFSLTATLRHSFYWLDISKHKDYFKFTPMLAFTFGTQQFGLNKTFATTSTIRDAASVTVNRGDMRLDQKLKVKPLSLTLYLRPEYSIGKFYIQPQLMLDYYFPGDQDKFTTFFSINTGFMF